MENYITDKVSLYYGDCFDYLPQIETGSVDAIIVDLPYGTTQNPFDIVLPFDRLWKEYERIIKDNGAIILFAQGLFYIDLVNSNRRLFRYDLVWDKVLTTGFLNANRMPLRVHENIAVFYKKTPTYYPQWVEGEPLHSRGKSYKTKELKNENYGKFGITEDTRAGSTQKHPKSLLSFRKPHPSIAKHRTEKSIELLEWLVRSYTNEGDIVLDNTMGVGTTILAALKNNRRAIGMELDGGYFDVVVNRVKKFME